MKKLIWVTVGAILLLLILGNIVSITGAGLACPDWPLCHGKIIPPLEPKVLLEYSHRLVGLITSALILLSTVRLWKTGKKIYRVISLSVIGLLLVQIPLGGIVVLSELKPIITSIHLVIAFTILSLFYVGALGIQNSGVSIHIQNKVALLFVFLLFVQSFFGALVRHTGAILACPDFPLCFGTLIPPNPSPLIIVHLIHRFAGFAIAILSFYLLRYGTIGKIAFGLVLTQVFLGGAIVLTKRNLLIVSLHYVNILVILLLMLTMSFKFLRENE